MMRARLKKVCGGTRGESMVMVTVLMLVFLTVGVSILTASAATTATSSARFADRQAYYYARSMLSILDDALREGEIGDAVVRGAAGQLLNSGAAYASVPETAIALEAAFPEGMYDDLAITDVQVVYKGLADVLRQTGGVPNKISVRLHSVELMFTATCGKQAYDMRVSYRYLGEGELNAQNNWDWSGKWVVQQVG